MNIKSADPQAGARLRQIRQHRGMSQRLLARTISVSVGTIQNYERGRVAITTDRLMQFARALQCEPADLLHPPGSPAPRYRHWRATHFRPYSSRLNWHEDNEC